MSHTRDEENAVARRVHAELTAEQEQAEVELMAQTVEAVAVELARADGLLADGEAGWEQWVRIPDGSKEHWLDRAERAVKQTVAHLGRAQ